MILHLLFSFFYYHYFIYLYAARISGFCCILIYMFMQVTYIYILDAYRRNEQQTQENFLKKIFTFHFIARVQKGCVGFYCERDLETDQKLQYFDPTVMAASVVSFSFFRTAQPEAQDPLCWVRAFFIASYQHLLWTPTHQGPKPLRPGVAFLTTSRLSPSPTLLGLQLARRTQLSYIIVRRPLDL